ncbi:MAG TPA: ATP-binding protein [Rudaea sp.]|nr:ATP-binding protein [Rudaea sp.]
MSEETTSDTQRGLPAGVACSRLLDCLTDPVLLVSTNTGTAWLNAAARELDDWLRVDDPARSLESEVRPAMPAAPAVSSTSGDHKTMTLSLKRRSGEERSYRAVILNAAAEPGDNLAACVLVRTSGAGLKDSLFDPQAYSEVARARLEEVQRQLLQADRLSTIGQLAAGVAHEINNPIGYVQSNLVTLSDYLTNLFRLLNVQDSALRQLRTAQPELLAQIEQVRQEIDFDFLARDLPTLLAESQEGISRVRKIIQDLREFSRAGHTESWTLADLHSGLDSTINIVWNELKYKVELVKHYGDIPPIECLPYQLNQVFMNILVNAGHAIEERGQITIQTHASGDYVYVEISDTGKGIAPEHLARVFEPFFTTKPVGKGTGLGLSISYGIVRKHSGEIDVRSEVGQGTMFVIKLPIRQQRAGAGASD